jgi:dipeptidyl aminopeptidase/acylaminoacyl peptidase
MKKLFVVLTVFAFALSAEAASKRFITENDLFRFTWIADPQISRDGSQIAFVRVTVDEKKEGYATSVWAVPTTPGAVPRQLTNGPRDSFPRWAPDGKSIAFLRSAGEKNGKPEPAQIFLLPLSGGESRALTSMPRSVDSIEWSPNGKSIAFTATTKPSDFDKKKKEDEHESDVRIINQAVYRANGAGYSDPTRDTHIWTVDAAEGSKPKQITEGEFSERDPAWSPDAALIYFISTRVHEAYYDPRGSNLYAVAASGGPMATVADINGPIQRYAVSPDGKWIAFAGFVAEPVHSYSQTDLFVIGTTPGSKPRNLTASYDRDILGGLTGDQRAPRSGHPSDPVWGNDSKTIFVTAGDTGRTNLQRFDVASGRMTSLTNGNQEIVNYGFAGGHAFALVSTPTMIGDLFALDDKGTLTRLTEVNRKLFDEIALTEPEEVWYTSSDGKKMEAWIQKPPDFDPSKKYPMILNIHGGPHAAYGYTFDHEFQWMAAKGYVVLYPNPRGSTTYGEEFGNIIQYHYPGDDYKDLMAGVDAVIARGFIDPKKLGVTGGSGGGVLTNWTITQTDRFAAAVSQRSIADWSAFWYDADFSLFQPSWFQKAPWEDPKDYAQRSAITFIDRVKTPLMLVEGEADYRTPPASGGEMMFRALKYRHVPAVMVRFPGESHELSRSGQPWHRVERLEHIVNWFDKWIQGAKIGVYDQGLRKAAGSE